MRCKHCGVELLFFEYRGGTLEPDWIDKKGYENDKPGVAMCPRGVKKTNNEPFIFSTRTNNKRRKHY